MAGAPQTAEEFYSQSLERLHLLNDLAFGHAQAGEIPQAIVSQWAADVAAVQAAAWERIVVVSRTAHRSLFDLGERMLSSMPQSMAQEPVASGDAQSLAQSLREGLCATVDADLAAEVRERLASLDYLAGLPTPTAADIAAIGEYRLGGLDPVDYVVARREGSRDAMSRSHEARVRGDIARAIETAYESDMLALDAYLVESALKWGDTDLLSVHVRWDLASAAVARLGSVPSDVAGAVHAVRDAIGAVLGAEEQDRLEKVWLAPG